MILASCKKETKIKVQSGFNLKMDITDLKGKITELDTINIWFNHSVCSYHGYERIEITKDTDSLKIRTEFKEETFDENPKWKIVYEKKITVNDTNWKIEEFLKRNSNRLNSNEKKYGTLQISHNKIKLQYFTSGLGDLNKFMVDYFETMIKLHPENKNGIYGTEVLETKNISEEIKETELEVN